MVGDHAGNGDTALGETEGAGETPVVPSPQRVLRTAPSRLASSNQSATSPFGRRFEVRRRGPEMPASE